MSWNDFHDVSRAANLKETALERENQALHFLLDPQIASANVPPEISPERRVWSGCRAVATITYRPARIARRHREPLLQIALGGCGRRSEPCRSGRCAAWR
jgi:hypothetical protein